MNYYPHHIGDYKAATAHLTNDEDLAYRRLLEMYYDTETRIPLDTQWVSRRLRVGTQPLATVLKDFFRETETGFLHLRCEVEIREYNEKAERSRANGKKGGRRKATVHAAKNPAGSQQDAGANPEPAQALANHEPLTKNHKPSIQPSDAGFDSFYRAYPKKAAKVAALKAWKAAKVKPEEMAVILADVERRKNLPDWKKDGGQFVPNPATYINGRRWEDSTAQVVSIMRGVI